MMRTMGRFSRNFLLGAAGLLLLLGPVRAEAQEAAPTTRTRQVKRVSREELLKKYKQTDTFVQKTKEKLPERQPTVTEEIAEQSSDDLASRTVGITIWRMRPSKESDEVKFQNSSGDSLTPVRVKSDTALREGDQVRLTIETPRDGYLYVIDRERYADGTLGTPYLIFPTSRILNGDNAVNENVTVEIPDITTNPPHFRLTKSRPDHIEEALVVIISDDPLPGIGIGRNASSDRIELSEKQFVEWTTAWAADFSRFDLEGGEGLPMEKSLQEVSTRTRALVLDDPKPQTLYVVPNGRAGEPMMVTVPLVIRAQE